MDAHNDKSYRIKRETLVAIAEKLRVLVGKSTPLTPSEIAYYIGKVIFTPQSYANVQLDLAKGTYECNASGQLPIIYTGEASTAIEVFASNSLSFGVLPTVYTSSFSSLLDMSSLAPETHATGAIIE